MDREGRMCRYIGMHGQSTCRPCLCRGGEADLVLLEGGEAGSVLVECGEADLICYIIIYYVYY